MTYSVEQLTADCVDETSVHHGFNVDNDYNTRFRTVQLVASMSILDIVGTFLHSFFLEVIEINEQHSVRNSLNVLCYQSNCMN